MWIDLTDFAVYEYQYQIRQARPNVSFPDPIPENLIEEQGFAPVTQTPPPSYNPITQDLVELPPVEIDGVWTQQWAVEPATPEEIAQREEQATAQNKSQAQTLLTETDWVDIPAVSDPANIPHLVNKDEFNTYRLALRSIAVTPPVTVDPWPVKPEEVWVTE